MSRAIQEAVGQGGALANLCQMAGISRAGPADRPGRCKARQRHGSAPRAKTKLGAIENVFMFRNIIIAAALTSLAALGSSIHPCLAAPSVAPTNAARTLTALGGTVRPGDAVYEMGSIGPQPSAALTHSFFLRNDTSVALTLDRLQASCPCTSAKVAGGTGSGTVVAPGQSLSVRVAVNPQMLSPGLLHKSVWVFVQGQDAPAATLEMTGALLPAASFSPPSLAFGQIERGTVLTLLLKATPLPERLEQGTELRLVSPDPDVQVTPVTPDASGAGALAETDTPSARAFRVRFVPHAHIGRLQGRLSLVLAHMGDPPGTMGPVVDTVAWRARAWAKT